MSVSGDSPSTRVAPKVLSALLVLGVALTLVPVAQATPATATELGLGTLGGPFGEAYDINDSGQVVGYSTLADDPGGDRLRAFSWTEAGGMVDLGTLGRTASVATEVNNNGQVIGYTTGPPADPGPFPEDREVYVAFSWTAGDGMVNLGTLGGEASYATGINDNGQVVGYSELSDLSTHAFVWTEADGMIDIGTLPGGSASYANAISASGQVVGQSVTTSGESHAFSWTAGGGFVDIGALAGAGAYSSASAVNASGQVVGQFAPAGGFSHAFSWTPLGGFVDLGTLGGSISTALAVNDNGQVIGNSDTPSGYPHGFSWTQTGGLVDLGTFGGPIGQAADVNDSGQVVGVATTAAGEGRAFSWTAAGGLVALSAEDYSAAHAVNDSGQVVGRGGSGGPPTLWSVGAPPAAAVVGTVTGPAGEPVAGASVQLRNPQDPFFGSWRTSTGADGSFSIEGPNDFGGSLEPGTYELYVQPPLGPQSLYLGEFVHDVVVVAGETTTVDVELALGGRLRGNLLDENGDPIPHTAGGPMIAVCPVPLSTDEVHGTPCNDGTMNVVDASGGGISIANDGAFTTTRGIEPGTWWVAGIDYSQGPPLIVGDQTSFTVGAGETVVCELRAPGPATCDGTVGAEGDGVSAAVEEGAPNGGDGNGDGTADSEQANVTSLPAAVGGGAYVTVATPEGTTLGSVSTTDPASLPDPPAEVLGFPGGLVSFTVEGVDPGGTVDVELIIDGGVGGAVGYYKYHDGVWVDFTDHAVFDGDTVTLTLTDGGAGDDDGIVDGRIVDPGGWAEVIPPADATVVEGDHGRRDVELRIEAATRDDPRRRIRVEWCTVADSATADVDFRQRCADFDLGRNQTSEDIRVMVRGDRVGEDDEDFLVRLTANGRDAGPGRVPGAHHRRRPGAMSSRRRDPAHRDGVTSLMFVAASLAGSRPQSRPAGMRSAR